MEQVDHREVLRFWFETLQPKSWFNGGEEVDNSIRERFEPWLDPLYAGEGEFGSWSEHPRGMLAAIIMLDQFPRNLYRRQPRSFAYDDKALGLALEGLAKGWDGELDPLERVFFYLPLEHSERMDIQDLSLARFALLVTEVEVEQRDKFRSYLDYAWRHYEIIRRFGRYPHRNDILGRESTSREREFLKQPGSSFL